MADPVADLTVDVHKHLRGSCMVGEQAVDDLRVPVCPQAMHMNHPEFLTSGFVLNV